MPEPKMISCPPERAVEEMDATGRAAGGGVAHDLNKLLLAIRGYAELAQGRHPDDPYIGQIIGAADGAASLIRQLR